MINGNTESSQFQDSGQPSYSACLDSSRLRAAEQRQREREKVDAGVASELDLVLRGLPYSDSVLRYANDELAGLRDVLLAAEPGRRRQDNARAWLVDATASDEERGARWTAYELVMASRDAHREAVRRERQFFRKTPGAPALAGGDELPTIPRHNPRKFLETLKTHHTGGANEPWVFLHRYRRARSSDARQLGKDAWRLAQQIREEQDSGRAFFLLELADADDWRRLRDAWRQQRGRTGADVAWQVYRQRNEDGALAFAVVHNDERRGGDALPADDFRALKTVTARLLAAAPPGARVRTSPGFGGNHVGSAGDGVAKAAAQDEDRRRRDACAHCGAALPPRRRKFCSDDCATEYRQQQRANLEWQTVGQLVVEGEGGLRGAAQLLGIELDDNLSGGRQMNHEDALLAQAEGGYTMRVRTPHRQALSIFSFILEAEPAQDDGDEDDMSHLTSTKVERSIDTKCDIPLPLEDWEPPDDWRRPSEPAPVYLEGVERW